MANNSNNTKNTNITRNERVVQIFEGKNRSVPILRRLDLLYIICWYCPSLASRAWGGALYHIIPERYLTATGRRTRVITPLVVTPALRSTSCIRDSWSDSCRINPDYRRITIIRSSSAALRPWVKSRPGVYYRPIPGRAPEYWIQDHHSA